MEITLENLSKKHHREWIFKDLNLKLFSGESYAITGPNGSGKSTFIQVIAGALLPTSGKITYKNHQDIPAEEVYQYLSFASPYLELIEEFTLVEFLEFHFKFKIIKDGMNTNDVMVEAYLEDAKNKYIKNFSSGMKQRLKLALCFFSQSSIILLDEPTSNLDEQGINWYKKQIMSSTAGKLVVIASNQKEEYAHCDSVIKIGDYK